jgi:glycosyltransferase involved in cell wall biosynthesis
LADLSAAPGDSDVTTKPLAIFVHGSAEMYGSDKVLLNVVAALQGDDTFVPVVVLHEDGPLMAAFRSVGVEVHVAHVVKIRRAMFGPRLPWTLWRELTHACTDFDRISAGRRVGLVYSNTLAVLGGAFWAWRRRLRHLWHVHEIILRPSLVRLGLPRLADWGADRVISNSRQTETWLLQQAPGLKSRSAVIFNGLAAVPAADAAAVAAFRCRLGLQATDVVVTLAGRLNHWKGQGLLIEAAALLQASGRLGDMHVLIVGDVFAGHEDIRSQLVALVAQRGLAARVHFVPFVADIYTVWYASAIAVVPSTEPEPFGMVAIEAMGCALPVVAAAHGGLLDIVQHENTGLLFEPRSAQALADALLRLATDPALRQRLGQAGAQRQVSQFSLHTQVQKTRELCQALVQLR